MNIRKALFSGVLEWVSLLAFAALIVLTVIQVLSRYVLKMPVTFTEEMGRFLFIWVSLLGAALVMKNDSHMRLDILKDKLSPRITTILEFFVFAAILIFSAVVFSESFRLIKATTRQIAPVSRLPMAVVYLVLPISTFFMSLYSVRYMYLAIKKMSRDRNNK
ncbi:TRAP transporter small permease [Marispirochaeta sp.]|jgi:TRAP-type C4-dicarboxylate transport system permease small subunit|uniref:TRAP transporter small permease n=1 Tax=Marispirochaeta sp. TaxID=2038653 RepID=UPI0029C94C26|nr:TRAP transporter small permease [Marispirochaeta sp.]